MHVKFNKYRDLFTKVQTSQACRKLESDWSRLDNMNSGQPTSKRDSRRKVNPSIVSETGASTFSSTPERISTPSLQLSTYSPNYTRLYIPTHPLPHCQTHIASHPAHPEFPSRHHYCASRTGQRGSPGAYVDITQRDHRACTALPRRSVP